MLTGGNMLIMHMVFSSRLKIVDAMVTKIVKMLQEHTDPEIIKKKKLS